MKSVVLLLVFSHFLGDWWLQSRRIAETKSKDFLVLLVHVAIVTVILIPAAAFALPASQILGALLYNAIAHGLIDWNLWRVYLYLRGESAFEDYVRMRHDYKFYSTIALDQTLHLLILFLIFL